MKLSFITTILVSSLYVAHGKMQHVRRAESQEPEGVKAVEENVLLKLSLGDGAEVKFTEPIEGVVMAIATADKKGEAVDLLKQHRGEASIAKLYKDLSGEETLPVKLEEALGRVQAKKSVKSSPPPKLDMGKGVQELTTSMAEESGDAGHRNLGSYYYYPYLCGNYEFSPAWANYYTFHDTYVLSGSDGIEQGSYVKSGGSWYYVASHYVTYYGSIWAESYGEYWAFTMTYASNNCFDWYIEYN